MSTLGQRFPNRKRPTRDPEGRFARQTRRGMPSDFRPDLGPCLIFTGSLSNGYGQFRYDDRNGYAHRYAWERVNGPIPAGLTIDHLCRVRNCVEVTHLELVDGVTNYLRGVAARTHCPNGHEYREPFREGFKRRCPACVSAARERSAAVAKAKTRAALGLPSRKERYDQKVVRAKIREVRFLGLTIAQAAREIGCNPNYLGRRIWRETRLDVLARDGACLRCGNNNTQLDVHHRIPRGSGGTARVEISFGMSNLVTLCRKCHMQVESDRNQANDDGYLLHRGDDPGFHPILTRAGWHYLTTHTPDGAA